MFPHILSPDFFELQLMFADMWSKKTGAVWAKVLFENTALYVRIFGYDQIDRPRIDHPQWLEFLDSLPQSRSEQIEFVFTMYQKYEREHASPKLENCFGCFRYVYTADNDTFELHFVNADPQGNFSRNRIEQRKKELVEMTQCIFQNATKRSQVRMGSWLQGIDAFTRLMPPQFTESADILKSQLTQNYTHWGQFLTKDGGVKKDLAAEFLRKVAEETHDNISPYFPIPPKVSVVDVKVFFDFYLNS